MTGIPNAELIDEGQSQIVIFPEEVRLFGSHMRIRRVEAGVLIEPIGPPEPVQPKPVKIRKPQKRKRR